MWHRSLYVQGIALCHIKVKLLGQFRLIIEIIQTSQLPFPFFGKGTWVVNRGACSACSCTQHDSHKTVQDRGDGEPETSHVAAVFKTCSPTSSCHPSQNDWECLNVMNIMGNIINYIAFTLLPKGNSWSDQATWKSSYGCSNGLNCSLTLAPTTTTTTTNIYISSSKPQCLWMWLHLEIRSLKMQWSWDHAGLGYAQTQWVVCLVDKGDGDLYTETHTETRPLEMEVEVWGMQL